MYLSGYVVDGWKYEDALVVFTLFCKEKRNEVNDRFRLMGKLNFIASKVCCTVNWKDRLHLVKTVQTFRGGLKSAWLRHFTSNSHWLREIVSSGEMGEWVQALHLKCRVYEKTR